MSISSTVESRFREPEFFKRAEALWEQLQGAVAKGAENGSGPFRKVSSAEDYNFLLATVDQVFTQDLVLAFLNNLRRWGKEKLDARHVSTPQIHIYVEGCQREMAPDATPTRWHYLYSLTRSGPSSVELLWEDDLQKKWFGLALQRVAALQLPFNHLLVHDASQAYALDGPACASKPLEGMILLHGYLW